MRISDWSSDVCSSDLMSTCGLVIEAATEREEIKRSIFEAVGKVLGHQAVLASNTSSIPITRLAQAAPDPKRFIGVHFRSEEHTSELQSLMRISYAVFCL